MEVYNICYHMDGMPERAYLYIIEPRNRAKTHS